MAFELNITAFAHAPWGGATHDADLVVLGKDWSGAAFLFQIGAAADLSQLLSLTTQTAGTQGVSAAYDSGYLHPKSGAVVGATTITPQIDETALEGLTFDGINDLVLPYTFYITPSGEPERVYCYGTFTIKQGVADA